ncbi:MAG: hypothetical protein ACRD0Z_09795 [Acidimicrobiales bacterium]
MIDDLRRHAEALAGDDRPVTLPEVQRPSVDSANNLSRRAVATATLVVVLVAASLGAVGLVVRQQAHHRGRSGAAPATSVTTTLPTASACTDSTASPLDLPPKLSGAVIRWVRVHTACSPSGRELAAVAALPDGVLVYGGQSADGATGVALGGTWLWTKGHWEEEHGAVHPPPLSGATMAYDPITKSVVLYGGSTNLITGSDATWVWSNGRWSQQVGVNPPDISSPALSAYSGVNRGIILFEANVSGGSGQTWLWRAGDWRRLTVKSTPPVSLARMTADPSTGEPLLFTGGLDILPPPYEPAQSWIWTGSSWHRVSTPPNLRETAFFDTAYDPLLSGILLVGGAPIETNVALTTAWLWRKGSWHELDEQGKPPANCNGALAFDAPSNDLLLFGGTSCTGMLLGSSETWLAST